MAKTPQPKEVEAKWWADWFDANYSWDALQYKKIGGQGGILGEATLQEYWRRDPSDPNTIRDDNAMRSANELIPGPDGRLWHIAHLPDRFQDGTETWKTDLQSARWDQLDAIVQARLRRATDSRVDRSEWDQRPRKEGRALLSGVILRGIPTSDAGTNEIHIRADRMGVLGHNFVRSVAFQAGADFSATYFRAMANFYDCGFSNFSLAGAIFMDGSWMYNNRHGGQMDCRETIFLGSMWVTSEFAQKVDFSHAKFLESASFSNSQFSLECRFEGTKFFDDADFSGASFAAAAEFPAAEFFGQAIFKGEPTKDESSSTTHDVNLSIAAQNQEAGERAIRGEIITPATDNVLKRRSFRQVNFTRAIFHGISDFSNRTFLAETDFSYSRFNRLAKFHDARLHQDTSFASAHFATPSEPASPDDEAADGSLRTLQRRDRHFEQYERAFRTLKLAMEELRARREEARFFRMELRARRSRPSSSGRGPKEIGKTEKVVSHLYELTGDFGESLLRPLLWLLALWGAMAVGYGFAVGDLPFSCVVLAQPDCSISPSVAIAAERTWLPFVAQSAPSAQWWHEATSGAQPWAAILDVLHRVSATVLIFLFALAARRKFQIS
jgi:uncharacterized protein YjbI with pentapeptide repeats